MGNWCCSSRKEYDDNGYVDDEGEEGEVVVEKRYTYANHRRRFEHRREPDDPASDSDENIRRLAVEMEGESNGKNKKRKSKKFERNNSMLQELLEGKKKKGFFSRKFAKLRGKNKKKDDDKDKDKKDKKKNSKKNAKEMELKARSRANTRLAMQEAMGETPSEPPKQQQQEEVDFRESITSKRRDRRESVADKVLSKQMVKYNNRYGFKKTRQWSTALSCDT